MAQRRPRRRRGEYDDEEYEAQLALVTSGNAFAPLFELFGPGYRHQEEQRTAEASRRDDVDAAAPPLGVDLDSGVAVIRVPKRDA